MSLARLRPALARSEDLPVEALEWALANRNEARPALLAMLTACAKPGDITEDEAQAAFYATYVLGAARDAGALPILCALARNGDRMDHIFGDALGAHLHRLLAGLCTDAAALEPIIADRAVDPFVRVEFLLAWRWLVASGGLARQAAWTFLIGLEETGPGDDGFFADEWARALIALDPNAAIGIAERALADGWIDEAISGPDGLHAYARDCRADPEGACETFLAENGPVGDVVGLLERWLSQAPASGADEGESDDATDGPGDAPTENPYRAVGRNDPCPCGSGKKFKKCCLAAMEAG